MDDAPTWPERFIYVCNAGGAMIVNLAPLLHAGKEHVAGVMILQGLSNPKSPTGSDQTHSLWPSGRLNRYATKVVGLPEERIRCFSGNGDLLSDWSSILNEAQAWAEELGIADVVYNVSGGRKPCTLGALLGMRQSAASVRVSLISVGQEPFDVRLIRLNGNEGAISENVLPVEARLSLDDYLTTYDFPERDKGDRLLRQSQALDASRFGQGILNWVDGPEREHAKWAISALHFAMGGDRGRGPKPPFDLKLSNIDDSKVRKNLSRALDKIGEIGFAGVRDVELLRDGETVAGLRVMSAAAQALLGGTWLEAAMYARLRDKIKHRLDVELAAGVNLPAADDVDTGELDLVALHNDRLQIVEIKAWTVIKGLHGELAKLANRKMMLAGQRGPAWLVAPLLDRRQVSAARLDDAASKLTVELHYGRGAVDRFIGAICKEFR